MDAVYRRRRMTVAVLGLIILAVVVGATIVIVQALRSPSEDPAPVAEPTETAEPTAPMPTGDDASGACPTEAVTVGAATNEKSYDPGASATLELIVTNTHDVACRIAVGTSEQTFTVRKDGETVWSSEYCADPEADGDAAEAEVVFAAGSEKRAALKWTVEPVDKNCNRMAEGFEGGKYELVTSLGETESEPVEFEITAPEPTEEPSEESAEEESAEEESGE